MILLIMSDSHGGFSLGLANPATRVQAQDNDKNNMIMITETNKFLWEDIYLPGIKETQKLADKDPIVVLHLGDIAHGIKYMTEALYTKVAVQFLIAAENMAPVLSIPNVKMLRIIAGTPAHSFGENSVETVVAELLKARFPGKDISAYYHNLLNINGFAIDCAHHGPYPGSRNWLKGNVAKLYLQSLMMDELALGNAPPKLVLRGHFHEYIKVWHGIKQNGYYHESWLIIAPPLCLLGDWARQSTRNTYVISPGILALEIIKGRLFETHFFGKTVDIRRKENIVL